MKKMTSMIAIILLFSLLFTGCNIYGVARFTTSSPIPLPIPIKQDFSSYGVSFKIAGSVTEVEGNKYGSAKFRTTLGNFEFERLYNALTGSIATADNLIALMAEEYNGEPRSLSNGASYFIYNHNADGSNSNQKSLLYAIQVGNSVWFIICTTTAQNFNMSAIIDVCTSTQFY